MVSIGNAIASAARLGALIHIRSCAAGIKVRVEISGAVASIRPQDVIAALDQLEALAKRGRVSISRTAARKLSKWAMKWGGPNRRDLGRRIKALPNKRREEIRKRLGLEFATTDKHATDVEIGERIHQRLLGQLSLLGTTTGRLSSARPNLSNVPKSTDYGPLERRIAEMHSAAHVSTSTRKNSASRRQVTDHDTTLT